MQQGTQDMRSIGGRVLDLLEHGRTEEARVLLQEAADGGGRQAALLNQLVSGSAETAPRDLLIEESDPDALSATVSQLILGQVALAEGRVEDLAKHVELAKRVALAGHSQRRSQGHSRSRPQPHSPWLRLRIASLAQAAYLFTGDEAHMGLGVGLADQVADRMDLPHMAVTARGILGTLHLLTGALHQVEACTRAGIELAAATGLHHHPSVSLAHQFLGYALFEWNRLPEARQELERAWELAPPTSRGVRSGVARMMTELAVAEGDEPAADAWFEVLEACVSEPMTLRNREWLAAVRARRGPTSSHQLRVLDAWRQRYDYRADRLESLSGLQAASRLHELGQLLSALEATQQWTDVLVAADTIVRGARGGREWFRAQALAGRAVAHEALGHPEQADEAWDDALAAGRRGSLTRTYTEGSPLRIRLLMRATDRPGTRQDAERILAASGHSVDARGLSLTPRQVDVIRQVATGLSNREVAEVLELGETTVRTHLRHIYERLGVGSRTAAVNEARRLGLLREGPG